MSATKIMALLHLMGSPLRPFHLQRTVWIAAGLSWAAVLGCGGGDEALLGVGDEVSVGGAPDDSTLIDAAFVDATSRVGLDFIHTNGMTGEMFFSEVVGAGVALFDYDWDGDIDVYLVQGGALGTGATAQGTGAGDGAIARDRLFRNEMAAGDPESLRFVDVTESSGLDARVYGMGVAAGDVDGDGWVDVYLTSFGENELWRNNGDGTFSDATDRSGTAERRWSVSSAFFDFDRDSDLDLFVGNYVDFSLANHKHCFADTGARDYCGPLSFRGESDRLFRNRGDGVFEDATGLLRDRGPAGGALGVVPGDFDDDGWPDVYVANDQAPNEMWLNEAGAGFRNEAVLAGVAVNGAAEAEASMGVEAGDFDGDGDDDLFAVHLRRESNTLWINDGDGFFHDGTQSAGLSVPSLPYTGFGTASIDYDGDGWLDFAVVNGAVRVSEDLAARGDPHPLHMTNQLFRNEGGGRFVDATAEAGPSFAISEVSRGLAVGDLDNDGDPDLVVTNNGGPARVFLCSLDRDGAFLGVDAVGVAGSPALGALVTVIEAGGLRHSQRVRSAGSYASSRDPRILVALGERAPADVEIVWPDGSGERFVGLLPGAYHRLAPGDGTVVGKGPP